MDVHHVEADSAGAASPADQPMAGLACVAHDGRGIGCPAENVVRTGRAGELAAVAAAHDGDHGEPQIELSDDPWVPGQSADRNAVRTISEALLSQPATKIYLKTSEPNAAEWISKAIGEVEIERCRETRTHGQSPQGRNSESQQRDISREPLVMASQILGLDPLHGYLKHGNYVVGCAFLT